MSEQWDERWLSIANFMGHPVPGRVPAMRSRGPASNISLSSGVSPSPLWFTDIRISCSWRQLVYSICIIEGYSRKIVAGMASPHQDLTAICRSLAALAAYGCPHAMVSDNGSVFR